MMCIPIFQGFALLYRDVFDRMGLSGADIGTIVNLNSAFGMMLCKYAGFALISRNDGLSPEFSRRNFIFV